MKSIGTQSVTKFYVVWRGRKPGVYNNWSDCQMQVKKFSGAKFKSFATEDEAITAFYNNPIKTSEIPLPNSYAVDASCIGGNPGTIEYQCVSVQNRVRIFKSKQYSNGTSNIGEFLGIVHALAFFQKRGDETVIYSDSINALTWLQNGRCNSQVKLSADDPLSNLIKRANIWLANNQYRSQVLFWDNRIWGENPADYGRK